MKNFMVFSLIVFEVIFAVQSYKKYCVADLCHFFSVNSFFEEYPQVKNIDFIKSSEGISINIALDRGVMSDSLKLFIDSFETPYHVVDGKIVVDNYKLNRDKIAYFLWQGIKMPDFIIEKPYFVLSNLNYFGDYKFSILDLGVEVFYSYEADFVSLGTVVGEFRVPPSVGDLKLRFTSDGLTSKDISIKFDMNSRPLISEILSAGGFLPGKQIKVRGVNLNSVTIDNKDLTVIYSGANEVGLAMDKNLNPGDVINFRLYSDSGYSNSVMVNAYSFSGKVAGTPVITSVKVDKNDIKISGLFFSESILDMSVVYGADLMKILKVSPGWISVEKPQEDFTAREFIVISKDLRSDPFTLSQKCDVISFQTCYFSN